MVKRNILLNPGPVIKYPIKRISSSHHGLASWNQRFGNNWIADRILWFIINFTNLTPNQITFIGLLSLLASAYFFLTNHLILGAIFFELRWIFDTIDGILARLKGSKSKFGAFWDNYVGNVGIFLCLFALIINQYNITKNPNWFLLGFLILFFRNLHSWESMKVLIILGSTARDLKESAKSKKTIIGSIISSTICLLSRYRLEDPFNLGDIDFLLFIIFPIISVFFGFLFEMWLLITIIMFLKAIFWFFYYSRLLINQDK